MQLSSSAEKKRKSNKISTLSSSLVYSECYSGCTLSSLLVKLKQNPVLSPFSHVFIFSSIQRAGEQNVRFKTAAYSVVSGESECQNLVTQKD